MKCDTFYETSLFLNMAAEGDELNLEELIKCVSIGKTSIDSVSSICTILVLLHLIVGLLFC